MNLIAWIYLTNRLGQPAQHSVAFHNITGAKEKDYDGRLFT